MRSTNEEIIKGLEVYLVKLEQEVPYLGPLLDGEQVTDHGYLVRKENRTAYPLKNHSLVVRIWSDRGVVGWGETYGLVAPQATAAIIKDFLQGFMIGRNAYEVEAIYDDLYNLLRVRGYSGGFYHDALAAVDIALWDLVGKSTKKPLFELLGVTKPSPIPAYISGLPRSQIEERCALAQMWQQRGFAAFKFALPMASEGTRAEMKALRDTLGAEAKIACDMHWRPTRDDALEHALGMAPYNPWFYEAPVLPEDIEAQRWFAKQTNFPVAMGEEWRTEHDAKIRIDQGTCQILQPEMGHTGITQFLRICNRAQAHQLRVIPHATIGAGIFLAASLQMSTVLPIIEYHEFQHSLFDAFSHYTTSDMRCEAGNYYLAQGHGIGVEPTAEMKSHMTLL